MAEEGVAELFVEWPGLEAEGVEPDANATVLACDALGLKHKGGSGAVAAEMRRHREILDEEPVERGTTPQAALEVAAFVPEREGDVEAIDRGTVLAVEGDERDDDGGHLQIGWVGGGDDFVGQGMAPADSVYWYCMGGLRLPRLYAIADVDVLAKRGIGLREFAEGLRAAGVSLVQLRDKAGSPQEVLGAAVELRAVLASASHPSFARVGHPDCWLIMNDRVDLALLAGFDGVHVGQGDLAVGDVPRVLWAKDEHGGHGGYTEDSRRKIVGVSTHTEEQVKEAEAAGADYVAIGPVFATGTKPDAEAVVGLDGVRRARALTTKPLVAIGGITRENARSVVDAGADSVAVISGLFAPGETVEKVARDFLEILR